jgi:hypothetical protein
VVQVAVAVVAVLAQFLQFLQFPEPQLLLLPVAPLVAAQGGGRGGGGAGGGRGQAATHGPAASGKPSDRSCTDGKPVTSPAPPAAQQ